MTRSFQMINIGTPAVFHASPSLVSSISHGWFPCLCSTVEDPFHGDPARRPSLLSWACPSGNWLTGWRAASRHQGSSQVSFWKSNSIRVMATWAHMRNHFCGKTWTVAFAAASPLPLLMFVCGRRGGGLRIHAYAAQQARVYSVWTPPSLDRRWWHPSRKGRRSVLEVNARSGGLEQVKQQQIATGGFCGCLLNLIFRERKILYHKVDKFKRTGCRSEHLWLVGADDVARCWCQEFMLVQRWNRHDGHRQTVTHRDGLVRSGPAEH